MEAHPEKFGDETVELAKEQSLDEFTVTWTPEEEKRVRNKLDWQIVSIVLEMPT